MGGAGAKGGNGADGARVVVHTNFPEILTLFEADVSGGEAGSQGVNGVPGVCVCVCVCVCV